MNELALFAGAGGGILGGKLLGWRTVCAVERDAYAASVLAQRQNERLLDIFPIWSNVETFDGKPWREIVDLVSGGFPCQDISVAGKGAGIRGGARSGLWSHMARIIGDVQPRYCFVENSPMLTIRGLDRVLFDLASMGYNAKWGVIGAGAVGCVSEGERIWIVGTSSNSTMLESVDIQKHIKPYTEESRRREYTRAIGAMLSQDDYTRIKRDSNVVARGMDRLKAIGNGQNPAVVRLAWETLSNE